MIGIAGESSRAGISRPLVDSRRVRQWKEIATQEKQRGRKEDDARPDNVVARN